MQKKTNTGAVSPTAPGIDAMGGPLVRPPSAASFGLSLTFLRLFFQHMQATADSTASAATTNTMSSFKSRRSDRSDVRDYVRCPSACGTCGGCSCKRLFRRRSSMTRTSRSSPRARRRLPSPRSKPPIPLAREPNPTPSHHKLFVCPTCQLHMLLLPSFVGCVHAGYIYGMSCNQFSALNTHCFRFLILETGSRRTFNLIVEHDHEISRAMMLGILILL